MVAEEARLGALIAAGTRLSLHQKQRYPDAAGPVLTGKLSRVIVATKRVAHSKFETSHVVVGVLNRPILGLVSENFGDGFTLGWINQVSASCVSMDRILQSFGKDTCYLEKQIREWEAMEGQDG